MELLRGEEVVNAQIEELKERVKPGTVAVVIQVGEDSASNVYVRNKIFPAYHRGSTFSRCPSALSFQPDPMAM